MNMYKSNVMVKWLMDCVFQFSVPFVSASLLRYQNSKPDTTESNVEGKWKLFSIKYWSKRIILIFALDFISIFQNRSSSWRFGERMSATQCGAIVGQKQRSGLRTISKCAKRGPSCDCGRQSEFEVHGCGNVGQVSCFKTSKQRVVW
jgi:hypothetical protein